MRSKAIREKKSNVCHISTEHSEKAVQVHAFHPSLLHTQDGIVVVCGTCQQKMHPLCSYSCPLHMVACTPVSTVRFRENRDKRACLKGTKKLALAKQHARFHDVWATSRLWCLFWRCSGICTIGLFQNPAQIKQKCFSLHNAKRPANSKWKFTRIGFGNQWIFVSATDHVKHPKSHNSKMLLNASFLWRWGQWWPVFQSDNHSISKEPLCGPQHTGLFARNWSEGASIRLHTNALAGLPGAIFVHTKEILNCFPCQTYHFSRLHLQEKKSWICFPRKSWRLFTGYMSSLPCPHPWPLFLSSHGNRLEPACWWLGLFSPVEILCPTHGSFRWTTLPYHSPETFPGVAETKIPLLLNNAFSSFSQLHICSVQCKVCNRTFMGQQKSRPHQSAIEVCTGMRILCIAALFQI